MKDSDRIKTIKKSFDVVSKLKKDHILNEDEIRSIRNLAQAGVFNCQLLRNTDILRCRPNIGFTNFFKTSDELTYPPVFEGDLKFQRLNTNRTPLFYGALRTPEMNASQIISLCEVVDFNNISDSEEALFVTLSKWLLSEHLNCAIVGLDNKSISNNSIAKNMRKMNDQIISQINEPIYASIHDFLNEEFSKKYDNHLDYQITCHYSQQIFNYGFDAIVYPSVKGNGDSLCIAIQPNIVDKYLTLVAAAVMRIYKQEKDIYCGYDMVAEKFNGNRILWETAPPNSQLDNFIIRSIFKKK